MGVVATWGRQGAAAAAAVDAPTEDDEDRLIQHLYSPISLSAQLFHAAAAGRPRNKKSWGCWRPFNEPRNRSFNVERTWMRRAAHDKAN